MDLKYLSSNSTYDNVTVHKIIFLMLKNLTQQTT